MYIWIYLDIFRYIIFACICFIYNMCLCTFIFVYLVNIYTKAHIIYIFFRNSSELSMDRYFRSTGLLFKVAAVLGSFLTMVVKKNKRLKFISGNSQNYPCLLLCFWFFSFCTRQFFPWNFPSVFALEQ